MSLQKAGSTFRMTCLLTKARTRYPNRLSAARAAHARRNFEKLTLDGTSLDMMIALPG